MKYDHFPVPLEKVNGELDLHIPGHWACRGFRGVHEGGVFHIDGRSYLPPGGGPERIYVVIQGDDVPVDTEDFKSALAPPTCRPGCRCAAPGRSWASPAA